tara:strand:+ start:709 stop:1221 length:513 start_codon:yes stop_codon:yes gene_type:complete
MSEVKVVDDFLPKEHFKIVQDMMLGVEFPWYYNHVIDYLDEEGKFQFTHSFFGNHKANSTFLEDWYPILFKPIVGWGILDRIKANLLIKTPEIVENSFHTDIQLSVKKPLTTSIFYVNTNNGYTKFKDGTIVKSIENRLLTFPVNKEHTGTTCTDENTRVVINLLYMSYE